MTPDDITTALLQQYGSRQRPLLLNPAPALAGVMPGSSVQPQTPQPVLPQAGVPAAPQPQRSQSTAMSLLDAMMRSGQAGGTRDPGMSAPQSPMGGAPGGSLLDSFNAPYWGRKLFGYTGGAPMGGSVGLPTMADISLPPLSSFAGL